MNIKQQAHYRERGAVSLFVVIFAMLLLTVVTVSFLRIVMTDLRQASDVDLSQSAFDSAQAGVEDAKRALLRYQAYCSTTTDADCSSLANQLSVDTCNTALRIGGVVPGTTGEVPVQSTSSSSASASFEQAYTCVTMRLNTEDVVGSVGSGVSKFISLKAADPSSGASTDFNEVTLSWFSQQNLSSPTQPVSLQTRSAPSPLLRQTDWPASRPPILRVQLMQTGSSFTLSDFDSVNASSQSNANTLFLYPTSNGATSAGFVGRDIRSSGPGDSPDAASPTDTPLPIRCEPTVASGGYACSVRLSLPEPVGGGSRQGYLRITPFYGATNFQVKLSNSGTPLNFKAVQPSIDSTGRANDIFRRVETRVDLNADGSSLPDAAVDVSTEFCKDFAVSDNSFINGTCSYN